MFVHKLYASAVMRRGNEADTSHSGSRSNCKFPPPLPFYFQSPLISVLTAVDRLMGRAHPDALLHRALQLCLPHPLQHRRDRDHLHRPQLLPRSDRRHCELLRHHHRCPARHNLGPGLEGRQAAQARARGRLIRSFDHRARVRRVREPSRCGRRGGGRG